jgi:hypothetical protein
MKESGMKYIIESSLDNNTLAEYVTTLIGQGWSLYGNPFVHNGMFFQAMTKTDKPESQSLAQKETLTAHARHESGGAVVDEEVVVTGENWEC